MKTKDYQTTITVKATPHEAFEAINAVTRWWTENVTGKSQRVGDAFTVRFGDVHVSTQKLVEVEPDKKVVWLVTESALNFVSNEQEWTNTKIVFEVLDGEQTQVRFTHHGLSPDVACYTDCSNAWSQYIQGSLRKLINTGVGEPTALEVNETRKQMMK